MTMRRWTRRGAGLAGLSTLAAPSLSAAATNDPLSGAALYADVKAYAAMGDHRTGTPGDLAATRWLEAALQKAGWSTERQVFDYPTFRLATAQAVVAGRKIEAFPLWTPRAGSAGGRLSQTPGRRAVALLRLPYGTGAALETSTAWRKPVQAAIDAGAAGVLVVTEHPLGEFAAYNCAPNQPPWPVPVLGVASREAATLQAAAEARAAAELTIAGEPLAPFHRGENVIARLKGAGKPLVLSTPRSGWFTCAGERGSGLAIWLGLARHFASRGKAMVLVAADGHEFDGYGGKLFAERLAPKPGEAAGWVHIGANVAAYDFALVNGTVTRLDHPQAGRRLAVSEALLPTAKAAFAGQIGYETPVDVEKEGAPGELAEYQRRGYAPLVGLVAMHPLHHTRRDLPDVTGPELLEPVARGLAAVIERL